MDQMSPNNFDLELQGLHARSVGRLLATEVFDKDAFDALRSHLCEKAELLKSEHVVSKQILDCLLSAVQVIQSRAEYLPEARDHVAMADEFFMLLGQIVIGEGCNDRRPGVPRVR
ncbi:hypothetical protein [Piscinibacter sp. HJYY11]|uniref:hypothetical protein n=1 Tax=Piscinibacter sp. HJYY11 TaxID=2801333 RepID=UPI00191F384D|nr:hypothetical protein [Piscinibacter sp. HJYY11]MBL0726077.1 hypothetical protein [Piscinibacter sp. HJYY11]